MTEESAAGPEEASKQAHVLPSGPINRINRDEFTRTIAPPTCGRRQMDDKD